MHDTPATSSPQRRQRALLWPLAIFVVLALIFALALASGDPSKLPSALIGKPAPQIDLLGVRGLSAGAHPVPGLRGEDLKGHASVVNFWASWCGPCEQEHPFLFALQAEGVRLYGINYKDQASAARRFLDRHGNPFTAIGVDDNGRTAIEWGVYGMPETFVVDGNGLIVYKHIGPITAEALQAKLIPAIRSAAR
jgi:cytochrome c biogenesis protein CcmG/thiol:disulfide interchange protein DsbE